MVVVEGPAVVLTREEAEREFLSSQEEYLSSRAMLSPDTSQEKVTASSVSLR